MSGASEAEREQAWEAASNELRAIAFHAHPLLEERLLSASNLVARVYHGETSFMNLTQQKVNIYPDAILALNAVGGQQAVSRFARYKPFEIATSADMHVSYARELKKLFPKYEQL